MLVTSELSAGEYKYDWNAGRHPGQNYYCKILAVKEYDETIEFSKAAALNKKFTGEN